MAVTYLGTRNTEQDAHHKMARPASLRGGEGSEGGQRAVQPPWSRDKEKDVWVTGAESVFSLSGKVG